MRASASWERVVMAIEAIQRDTLREVDRRVKAYQNSSDELEIVDRTREALTAIAEKRRH